MMRIILFSHKILCKEAGLHPREYYASKDTGLNLIYYSWMEYERKNSPQHWQTLKPNPGLNIHYPNL